MCFSKKQQDFAMKVIIEYLTDPAHRGHSITPDFLYYKKLPKNLNAEQLTDVLCAKNLIQYEDDRKTGMKFIHLTPKGRYYLEKIAEEKTEKRIEWIRYLITTIISVIAIILSAISIASQIGLIKLPQA